MIHAMQSNLNFLSSLNYYFKLEDSILSCILSKDYNLVWGIHSLHNHMMSRCPKGAHSFIRPVWGSATGQSMVFVLSARIINRLLPAGLFVPRPDAN